MNVQYAIKDGEIYVIEVNPRASRTVPFVSKATGQSLGENRGQGDGGEIARRTGHQRTDADPKHISVKEVGLPVQQIPRRGRHPRAGDAHRPAK